MIAKIAASKLFEYAIPFIIAALTALGSVYMTNRHDGVQAAQAVSDKISDLDKRTTQLEARQPQIDHIQSQVDKLVEWALGHK